MPSYEDRTNSSRHLAHHHHHHHPSPGRHHRVTLIAAMQVLNVADNIGSIIPPLAGIVISLLIPRAARISLVRWRALQAYDAQPAPGVERSLARPKAPSTKVKAFCLLLALAPASTELFLLGTVTIDDGSHPLLASVRLAIAPAILGMAIAWGLWPLIVYAARLVPYHVMSRNVDVGKNTALSSSIVARINRIQARRIIFVVGVVLFLSMQWASVLMRTSSTMALVHAVVAGSLIWWRSLLSVCVVMNKKTSLRSHIVLLGVVMGVLIAYIALVIILAFGITWLFGLTNESTPKKQGGNQTEKSQSSFEAWMDNYGEKIGQDLAIWQCIEIFPALVSGLYVILSSELACLAYRFDVSQADEATVTLSEEESKRILDQSREAACEYQRDIDAPHPWDNLGRYPVDLRAAKVPQHGMQCKKPVFYGAMCALIGGQIIYLLLELLFVPSKYTMPRIPMTKSELIDAPDNFQGMPVVNMGPLLAYPFVMVAMAGAAYWHGGAALLRRLWSYEEMWGQDYSGAPECNKDPTADVASSEKVANETDDQGLSAHSPLLLPNEEQDREQMEDLV